MTRSLPTVAMGLVLCGVACIPLTGDNGGQKHMPTDCAPGGNAAWLESDLEAKIVWPVPCPFTVSSG